MPNTHPHVVCVYLPLCEDNRTLYKLSKILQQFRFPHDTRSTGDTSCLADPRPLPPRPLPSAAAASAADPRPLPLPPSAAAAVPILSDLMLIPLFQPSPS